MDRDEYDDASDRDQPRRRERRSPREADFHRSSLERLAAELLKRGLEAGRDTLKQTDEALKQVGDSVVTREVAKYLASQLGDVRHTMTKAVASEFGRFLREADFAAELRKALSGMTVEANLRFNFPAENKQDESPPSDRESEVKPAKTDDGDT